MKRFLIAGAVFRAFSFAHDRYMLRVLALVTAIAVLAHFGMLDGPSGFVLIGMAAPADYWGAQDLKALTAGGLVSEDVMAKIWNISRIPLPFTELVGTGERADNSYTEWTQDAQATPDTANAAVDGADSATGNNKAAGGTRVGNQCQQSIKDVYVTDRANAVAVIGRSEEMGYQLAMRQIDLMRDLEAIALTQQASVADNGNATAGKVGAFAAWVKTNADWGAGGAAGGFNTGTKIVDAPTVTTARRALSIATLKTQVQNAYIQNGNVTALMSRPELTSRINAYILANPTAFGIATPTANVSGENPLSDGMAAQGYVSILVTDFGTTMRIIPNRLYQLHNDGSAVASVDLMGIDPSMAEFAFMIAPNAKPIGRRGTADGYQVIADWTIRVLQEKAHFIIHEINHTTAVTA